MDPAGGVGRRPKIEAEIGREKAVGGLALGRTVVVAFKGEMGIGDAGTGAVVAVDFFQERKLDARGVGGPVLAVGDEKLGAGHGGRGDHGVAGEVIRAAVHGQTALAGTAAEEMRGDHHHRHAHGHARIERREHERLRAAARFSGDADTRGIGNVEREQEIAAPGAFITGNL